MTSPIRICLAVGGAMLLGACDPPRPADPAENFSETTERDQAAAPPTRPRSETKRQPEPAIKEPTMPSATKTTAPPPKPPPAPPQREIVPAPAQPPAEVQPAHRDPGDEVPH